MSGLALATAAHRLVGVAYRHNGRDPATGLDCLGVLVAALTAIGRTAPVPARTAMHRRGLPDVADIAEVCGLRCFHGAIATGDVLLVRCSPLQLHVLVAVAEAEAADRFVHAHAGLRRVVLGPRDPAWLVVEHWQLTPSKED